MITVAVKRIHGAETVRASISAPSIEEAVRIAGEGTRLEFPIDGELFFAQQRGHLAAKEGTDHASATPDGAETAHEAGLPTLGELPGGARREAPPAGTSGTGRRVDAWAG